MQDRPKIMSGMTEKVLTGHGTLYVTVNSDSEGHPFEVFSTLGKAGNCEPASLEAISRLISLALRSGVPVEDIIRQLRGISCCPVWDNGVSVKSISDAIALVLNGFKTVKELSTKQDSIICSECGGQVYMMEGCWKCIECGNSKCK